MYNERHVFADSGKPPLALAMLQYLSVSFIMVQEETKGQYTYTCIIIKETFQI